MNKNIVVMSGLCLITGLAHAQGNNECEAFLKNPVFTSETINSETVKVENFRLLQCSANWKSSSEARAAGVSVTVPIYNIPIPINANWNRQKVEAWKSSNCTNSEINSDYVQNIYWAIYSIAPITAKAALECYKASFEAAQSRALRCRLTELSSSLVFEAEWRRTPGETNNPPIVSKFTTVNTECFNSELLSSSKPVLEGGISILCSVQENAAAFSLNTSRGSCIKSATPKLPAVTLQHEMFLDKPTLIAGQSITIPQGAKITTNGYSFTLEAEDTLNINGDSNIRSFDRPMKLVPLAAGKYAGVIRIIAKNVKGNGSVSILNAGTPGGPGTTGAKGAPGIPGGPGKSRSVLMKKICKDLPSWVQQVCPMVPTGCTGGNPGGNGERGGQGNPGYPGAPGGGAG